ncbi:MAG: redoxin domain-containing protein [Oligoflexia bacterium]|nr:redoxin domain-containing protein [Oligoflexia bacterium]
MIKVGDKAPDFELPDSTGNKVKLSSVIKTRSPLALIFYKFNCPTCQFTFQYLPRIAKDLGPDHFLPIAQDEPLQAEEFKKKYSFSHQVLCDQTPYPVSVAYGILFVPTFFVIESDLTVSAVIEGFDKKAIESFSVRIANLKGKNGYLAFQPNEQVPLLKPG